MKITLKDLSEKDFILKYIDFYNLNVSEEKKVVPTEALLIAEFLLLPDDKFRYQRFGTLAKNKVIEAVSSYNWKLSKINLNNKLYSLIGKDFIRRDEDSVMYLPTHITNALSSFRKDKEFTIHVNFQSQSISSTDVGKD